MANKKNMIDFAESLSALSGKSKTFSASFIRSFFDLIKNTLYEDSYVKIKGFGTFKLITVNGRESVNVNTGERIEIGEHLRLSFVPDKQLAQRVNRPFENFTTLILDDEADAALVGKFEPEEVEEEAEEIEVPAVSAPAPVEEKALPAQYDSEEPAEEQTPAENVVVSSVYIGNGEPENETLLQKSADETEPAGEPEEELPAAEESEQADVPSDEESPEPSEPEEEEPQSFDSEDEEEAEPKKSHKARNIVLCLFGALVLVAASYYAGYNNFFGLKFPSSNAIFAPKPVPVAADSAKTDSVKAPASKVQAVQASRAKAAADSVQIEQAKRQALVEKSKKYKQLPDGDYLIAGTWKNYVMSSGDNLYRIAQKNYRDKELAKYLIFYNDISNPDLVTLGTSLRLPVLVEKK